MIDAHERMIDAHERMIDAHERMIDAHERMIDAHERTTKTHCRCTADAKYLRRRRFSKFFQWWTFLTPVHCRCCLSYSDLQFYKTDDDLHTSATHTSRLQWNPDKLYADLVCA